MENIREKIEANFNQYIDDLKKLIRIPSVYEEDKSQFPFGKNIDDALREMLAICERMGLSTYYDPNGYYGYAQYGQGEEMLGILGHLDVVPAGDMEKWNTDPFDPVIKDGKIYGRGTQDDKGPTLSALYAFKAVIDTGIDINKKVRFIFGTDEENLWRCINEYNKKEQIPNYAFTPDASFPLIYAEKGLLQVDLISKNKTNIRLSGGDAYNSVPSNISLKVENELELESALNELGFEYKKDKSVITVLGKSVHAKDADTGINAIARLLIALSKIGYKSNVIDFVVDNIGEDALATKIFGDCSDEVSGNLKFNIGKIKIVEETETLNIDIRIPVTVTKEFVLDKLKVVSDRYGFEIRENDYLRSIYTPLDSPLVKKLMQSYVEVTGDIKSQPISSGGATYARAMDNCVAFGPAFPYTDETEHQPNEYVKLDEVKKAIEVYSSAFIKLL